MFGKKKKKVVESEWEEGKEWEDDSEDDSSGEDD